MFAVFVTLVFAVKFYAICIKFSYSREFPAMGNFAQPVLIWLPVFVRSLRNINLATPVVGHGILLLFIVTLYVNSLVKCAVYLSLID